MVPAKEIGSKMQSKREVYRFLSSEVKAYLGAFETMTIWHLRDIESGDKSLLLSKDVKHISVPNYKDLTIEKMVAFARGHPVVMNALPIDDEIKHLHRQYLANVIFHLVGQPFMDWVDNGIATRNVKVSVEANNMVKMDPRVYEVYKTSTTVSSKYQ